MTKIRSAQRLAAQDDKSRNEMSLKAKLRQRTFVNYFSGIDWEKGSDAPMVVEFDPTTACNLACPDCINRELLNQGFFSRDRIRELAGEMVDAGVKAVVLIGGGEPLIHPEIDWVIEYFGRNGVKIGITTNGLLIDKHLGAISEYASWVRVSVDAATPETFKHIRPSRTGESMFGKLLENMKMYAKVKKGTLGYSFMIYTEGEFSKADNKSGNFSNVDEIALAAQIAKDSGCDYFEIKPMYNINHFAVCQKTELISKIMDQINKAAALADDNFRVLFATKLGKTLSGENSREEKAYHRCAVAQLRTLVTPSGVYVCPYFRGRQDKKIGDVRKMSFLDMWHGKQRADVITALDPSRDCKMPCIRHESNLIVENMIKNSKVDIIDDFDLFI
ncbi:MAG: radical SAM protein [Victivallales bacterium]|nr:radical SAM protein [Victivallales bacterium]